APPSAAPAARAKRTRSTAAPSRPSGSRSRQQVHHILVTDGPPTVQRGLAAMGFQNLAALVDLAQLALGLKLVAPEDGEIVDNRAVSGSNPEIVFYDRYGWHQTP
ncbi:MAG TPA: hypothetical protein PLT48_07955, partial [Nitrospira sp.]|nr:hypothetical protein [Nitrospira sp.]